MSDQPEVATVYPPLTAKEFADGCGDSTAKIPMCEDEHGEYLYAMFHVPPHEFVTAAAVYYASMVGPDQIEAVDPADVKHVYAVTVEPADGPNGWFIRWGGVEPTTPGAFPLTVVTL